MSAEHQNPIEPTKPQSSSQILYGPDGKSVVFEVKETNAQDESTPKQIESKRIDRGLPTRLLPAKVPYTTRAKQVVEFAASEIEAYRLGLKESLSTLQELSQRFGYSHRNKEASVRMVLAYAGLGFQRREIFVGKNISPSIEYAWMLGVIVGRGSIVEAGKVSLRRSSPELLQSFKNTGEELFKTNASVGTEGLGSITFYNAELAREIGNLNRSQWPEVIKSKHPWVLADTKYNRPFLEGLFDTRGKVVLRIYGGSILFPTTYINAAGLICDLLARIGVENPLVTYFNKSKSRTTGVTVRNQDAVFLANNLHSKVIKKESQLETLRQLGEKIYA